MVTDFVVSFLAYLGAWVSFLEFLPHEMRMHDVKLLFDFVIETQFVLTANVGRCCLDQRVDELLKDPGSSVWKDFDEWMEMLEASLQDAIEKWVNFACGLPVSDGVLFDQLAHAVLLFGVRCHKFDPDDRVINLLNGLVHKITKSIYTKQTLDAFKEPAVSLDQ